MEKFVWLNFMIVLFLFPGTLLAQKVVKLNLAEMQSQGKLITGKKSIQIGKEGKREYIKFGEGISGGAVWLPVDDFKSGKIELVARGKDILQGSFLGIAFHAVNDSTYDAVYCRPFNFQTTDSLRRIHMIQYTFAPKYEWNTLRTRFNGIYEKGIPNPPLPNDWIKMTLIINDKTVEAYINDEKKPSLVVGKLNENSVGKVGVFGTNGDFESVQIKYSKK